ncbi:hypothetical protein [uncultured Sulfitobacter sp.]|uniref:hypothetical protein n=1 Tax=uncultured Sulfitobacter sp. TaxID=191468 RepID=UPI00261CCECF|nr:hypothetical protein [uncultured Sulfitobacter sp.]
MSSAQALSVLAIAAVLSTGAVELSLQREVSGLAAFAKGGGKLSGAFGKATQTGRTHTAPKTFTKSAPKTPKVKGGLKNTKPITPIFNPAANPGGGGGGNGGGGGKGGGGKGSNGNPTPTPKLPVFRPGGI